MAEIGVASHLQSTGVVLELESEQQDNCEQRYEALQRTDHGLS